MFLTLILLKLIISIAVPLGSIRELPAESSKEIKASEAGQVVNHFVWRRY